MSRDPGPYALGVTILIIFAIVIAAILWACSASYSVAVTYKSPSGHQAGFSWTVDPSKEPSTNDALDELEAWEKP